jgi:hypothetical protein
MGHVRPSAIVAAHLIALAAAAAPAAGADAAPTARPIQFMSQAEVPEDAPQEARTIQFTHGFSVGYLVEGANIVGVKEKSLHVAHALLPDGTDIAQTRSGDDNLELGPFPRVSDSGRFAYFSATSKQNIFGHADHVGIEGTVVVITSSKLGTLSSHPHKLGSNDQETLGAWKATFGGEKGMSFGDDDKPTASITIKGPLDGIAKLTLQVAGKDYKQSGWGGGDDERTYSFPCPADAAGAVLTIRDWEDLHEVTVPLGK